MSMPSTKRSRVTSTNSCLRPAGRQKPSVALARTVLQRRLASSTMGNLRIAQAATRSSSKLLEELEVYRLRSGSRLAQLQGRLIDAEQDEDDLDDEQRDQIADGFTTAMALDQLARRDSGF